MGKPFKAIQNKASMKARARQLLYGDKQPPRMSPDEKRLVRAAHFEQGRQPSQIAADFGRNIRVGAGTAIQARTVP